MRRIIWLTAVAVVVLGAAGFALVHLAGTHPARASVRVATKTTYRTLAAGGRERGYDVIAPASGLPASAPVIVVLSGYGAAIPGEIKRDQLTPYVSADDAELVYPVPVSTSHGTPAPAAVTPARTRSTTRRSSRRWSPGWTRAGSGRSTSWGSATAPGWLTASPARTRPCSTPT